MKFFKYKKSRISLNFMHSGKGTKVFKGLSRRGQHSWSAFDRIQSRRAIKF